MVATYIKKIWMIGFVLKGDNPFFFFLHLADLSEYNCSCSAFIGMILKHFPAVTISSVNVAPSRKCKSNVGLHVMLHCNASDFLWLHTIQ